MPTIITTTTAATTFASKLWVVNAGEGKKLYPLMLMMFLICFSYTLLRSLKDIMVLEIAPSELISYLKLMGTLPVSIIFMLVYTKLSLTKSKPFIFYANLSFFMLSYAGVMLAFSVKDRIQPIPNSLESAWIPALRPIAQLCENWILVVLFIMSEMYGTIVLALLFWGFANGIIIGAYHLDICSVEEAKRFYPLISLVANVALGIILASVNKALKQNKDLFLQIGLSVVILCGAFIACIYHYMQTRVLASSSLSSVPRKQKEKPTLLASLKIIASSTYIAKISILVIAYGMLVNFAEIYYYNMLSLYWLDSTITGFSIESLTTGGLVIILSLFIGSTAIARYGWTRTALATPCIFGIPFLAVQLGYADALLQLIKAKRTDINSLQSYPTYPLVLPIYIFGVITVLTARAFKYSFFDPTKEMAYIPLPESQRSSAKAGVDVVASRLGKSASSLLFIGLNAVPAFNGMSLSYVAYVLALFCCLIVAWIWSTISLGKEFDSLRAARDIENHGGTGKSGFDSPLNDKAKESKSAAA